MPDNAELPSNIIKLTSRAVRYGIITILLITSISCSHTPKKVSKALEAAAENKKELDQVIEHYKNIGDNKKLRAAYFLLENMATKYSVVWKNREKYELLYERVAHGSSNVPTKTLWDSLNKVYDVRTEFRPDIKHVTAELIIKNIDLAFYAWKNMPWGKHYDFDQFCEFILPYRVEDEPLENWRPFLFEKMKWLTDSLKKTDIREACKYINDYIHKLHKIMPSMSEVPKLGTIDSFNHPAGICEHRMILIINMLRTFGIPCTVHFTPQYTNFAGGHSWIALIDTTGLPVAFSGGDILDYHSTNKMPMGFGKWGATKIYEQRFKNPKKGKLFQDDRDVTHLYDMPVGKVGFKLPENTENKEVYLCTFGLRANFVAVASQMAKSDSIYFNNVGLNSVYFPAIHKRELIAVQNPVYFDSVGNSMRYTPDEATKEQIRLYTKFPDDGTMYKHGQRLLGCKIEGSNSRTFRDSVLLHVINEIPYYFVKIDFDKKQKPFRYLRFTANGIRRLHLTELEFYSNNVKLTGTWRGYAPGETIPLDKLNYLADGSLETVLDCHSKSRIILDLGKPLQINAVKYVQRSRLNYVDIGDTYDLLYFDREWKSLGQKIATDSYLDYDNAPRNTVFLLRDLTKGKQERIFVYENNQQVWR